MATGLGGHIIPRDETSRQLSSNSWGQGPGSPRDDDMQPAATCLPRGSWSSEKRCRHRVCPARVPQLAPCRRWAE